MTDVSVTSQRRIFKTSAMMGGASLVAVMLGIVRTKAVAVTIGPVGVGAIGLYQNAAALIIGIVGFGVGSAIPREIAAARIIGGVEGEAAVRRAIYIVTLLLAGLGAVSLILLRSPISQFMLNNSGVANNVGWLAIAVAFGIISNSQLGLLTGLGRIADVARANVFAAFAATILSVIILLSMPSVADIGIVLITYICTFASLSWYVFRDKVRYNRYFTLPDPRIVKKLFVLGITITTASLFPLGSLLLIRHGILDYGTPADLGYFQASWTIASLYLVLVLQGMAADFFPRLTSLAGNEEAFEQLINDQTEVALLVGGPIILFVLGAAPFVVKLLYGDAFYSSLPVLRWQLIGDVLKIATWPFGFALLALNRRASYIIGEAVAAGALLTVSFVLLPSWGISAFGVGYLAMYICQLPLLFWLTQRGSRVRWTKDVIIDFSLLLVSAFSLFALLPANPVHALLAGGALSTLFSGRSFLRLRYLLPRQYAEILTGARVSSIAAKVLRRR